MTRLILFILAALLFFTCSRTADSQVTVREIYYREPSPESFGTYKTELLMILSNGQGFRFLDDRPASLIMPILTEKINLLSESDFNPRPGPGTSSVQRINIDHTNFILVINDPSHYNQILKCHYNKASNELKFKKFIIDHGDTLNILEPNSDTSGVYYYKCGSAYGPHVDLRFPNPDKVSNRDITTEKVGLKPALSYEEEISNYVQFEKSPVSPDLFDNYKNNSFALKFIEKGPNGRGREFGYSIEIVDGFAFLLFSSDVDNGITFQHNRPLTATEVNEIKDAVQASKLENNGMYFPRGINGYQCGHTQIILKNEEKRIAGGVLSPMAISGSLARYGNDPQQVFSDCRAHSSTLNGDYGLVFKAVKNTFTQLDSLFQTLHPGTQ